MTALTIDKKQIEATLDLLETLSAAATPEETHFYAKVAMLEVSGWAEEKMDDFVLSLALPHLRDEDAKERFRTFVKQIHGFTYEDHFSRLLGMAIGAVHLERIEKNMDGNMLKVFKTDITQLSKKRNRLAHTSFKGMQQEIDELQTTRTRLRAIHAGLQAYAEAITPSTESTPRAGSTAQPMLH